MNCVFLLLSACSSVNQINTLAESVIKFGEGVNYQLTAPPMSLVGKSQTHLVEIKSNGKIQSFIAQVEYQKDKISLVAISAAGVPLFDFVWQAGKIIKSHQYLPLPELNINYVVADIQWVHWPIKLLSANVVGENIDVTEVNKAHDWQRSLVVNGQKQLLITKTGALYHLEHINRGYNIDITVLTGLNKEQQ